MSENEKHRQDNENSHTTVSKKHQTADKETAGNVNQSELPLILEALLFATDEPLPPQKIKSILPNNPDMRKIKSAIQDINNRLSAERHPFEVAEVAGGYQFKTVQYYHNWVRHLFKEKIKRRLSHSGLETLAIIAYKQPVTKAEIEAIRGVVADGAMKTLLERRLIKISGRSDKPGRALLYATTKDFLKYFGLNHLDDLPKLEEFTEMVKAQEEVIDTEEGIVPLGDERQEEFRKAQELESIKDEDMPIEDEHIRATDKEKKTDAEEDTQSAENKDSTDTKDEAVRSE